MVRRIEVSARIVPVTFLVLTSVWSWAGAAQAQQPSGLTSLSQHKNNKYAGLTKCAACHFDQYRDWKGSEHNKAFEILPLKYRTVTTCLECHTTGDTEDAYSHQFGVSCESCHGPGEQHANLALRFVNELITEDGLAMLREKIQRLDMHQCVKCHISKAHKKHPPYDRDAALPPTSPRQSGNFFDNTHRETTTLQSPLRRTLTKP